MGFTVAKHSHVVIAVVPLIIALPAHQSLSEVPFVYVPVVSNPLATTLSDTLDPVPFVFAALLHHGTFSLEEIVLELALKQIAIVEPERTIP